VAASDPEEYSENHEFVCLPERLNILWIYTQKQTTNNERNVSRDSGFGFIDRDFVFYFGIRNIFIYLCGGFF
jgi:hypothetical protein